MSADRYDAAAVVPTVVHLGPGAFHRAHQAVYADDVLATGSTSGAICAISLRASTLPNALAQQGFRYHLVTRDDAADEVRAICSIRQGLTVASDGTHAVVERLVDPKIEVVTITVTEKGYCAVGASGALDIGRVEIGHDISRPDRPQSLPGVLVEALARRRALGLAPFTVCSCDNIRANGATTRRVVTELAAHRGGDLAEWIAGSVAFPSSMVDRMVPAPTQSLGRTVLSVAGADDECAVAAEPFSQWVIEEAFSGGRPPWERVGVEFVGDVAPYELTKVRVLNGAHSAFAYLGLLAGHSEIAEAVADPRLIAFVRAMLADEVVPTLARPRGVDLDRYCEEVLHRFRNRRLGYTTSKVAGDGAGKLPGRILGTIRDRLADNRSIDRLALVVAAYAACLWGPSAGSMTIADPALDRLLDNGSGVWSGTRSGGLAPRVAVDHLLSIGDIFGPDLSVDRRLRDLMHRSAELLWRGDLALALDHPGTDRCDAFAR